MDITMNAQVCAETDIGLRREQNEDCYLIITRKIENVDIQNYGMMFAVADGRGRHAGGEIASKMACRGIADYYSEKADRPEGTGDFKARLEHLRSNIGKVHNKIIDYGRINKEFRDNLLHNSAIKDQCRRLVAREGPGKRRPGQSDRNGYSSLTSNLMIFARISEQKYLP
jgi:serine/threonine protein phosphatase PrpC